MTLPLAQHPARRKGTLLTLAAGLSLAATGLSACTQATTASGKGLSVTSSDTACTLNRTDLEAGTNTLELDNQGSKTTEVYVYRPDGSIVAEREDIAPGTKAQLTVEVDQGVYDIVCKPGQTGKGLRQRIQVGAATTAAAAQSPELTAAVTAYRAYLEQQAQESLPVLQKFTDAVKAGDVATAAATYAPSRQGWERIEPVAESFGDLDPKLDLREADLEPGQEWTGWHRLEKAVFATKSVKGEAKYADQLLADYQSFIARIPSAQITPTSMGNGAKELLDEVATGKITGEEDIWSGTDLWDFAANVQGAQKVYELLRPVVMKQDAALATSLDTGFAQLTKDLTAYAEGDGYVNYSTVTPEQRKALTASVDALAEPLSHLAVTVTKG